MHAGQIPLAIAVHKTAATRIAWGDECLASRAQRSKCVAGARTAVEVVQTNARAGNAYCHSEIENL